MYQNQTAVKEEVLTSYIEQIFSRYDSLNTGSLNFNDLNNFFNDLFKSVDIDITLTPQQSQDAIKAVFPNHSSTITKN